MDDVAELAKRYRLSPEAQSAFDALVQREREAARAHPSSITTDRYEDLGLIGTGASGEVRRVRDRDLNRVMAMKIVKPGLLSQPRALARFVEEAQATAQLQHPAIVPVHELGRLPDGRLYYTMKEVRGDTLSDVIRDVHAASGPAGWSASASGWTFRRVVDAFHHVCEVVAYAHDRGVIHRDLKPDHVMLGRFGEVLVVDWGLAKVFAGGEPADERVVTSRSQDASKATYTGTVAGTPAYMPPEQALGETARLGPRTDVYALGAVLYEILSGCPPFDGRTAMAILKQVMQGPPLSLASPDRVGPALPPELVAVCERAMAREPEDRFPDAASLAAQIGAWLEGATRSERAQAIVAEADGVVPVVAMLRAQAAALREEAQVLLADVRPFDNVEKKLPGWEREDQATRLEESAEMAEVRLAQTLRAALAHNPDEPGAHARLAEHYHTQHAEAERTRDRQAPRYEALLRSHDTGVHAAYLQGDGALTLITDPPGAEVELFRYVRRQRRLFAEPVRSLGRTPLAAVTLPMGSYLIVLRAEGRDPVRYPVSIGREEHWDGVRPGGSAPVPVALPFAGELEADDVYVPGGWFWSGGDPMAPGTLARGRVWADGFVARRFPVTKRQFTSYVDDLVRRGKREEARMHAPPERAADRGWLPEFPAGMIDWHVAAAYARWEADRTLMRWRLPGELEWEKAARGVDGRIWPWGDFHDPIWCCMQDSHDGRVLPAVVDSYPVDESPYGVRGMAGNVQEWCAEAYRSDGPVLEAPGLVRAPPTRETRAGARVVRGGAWTSFPALTRAASRSGVSTANRFASLGLRLVRSWP